jgi:hypothetical protein
MGKDGRAEASAGVAKTAGSATLWCASATTCRTYVRFYAGVEQVGLLLMVWGRSPQEGAEKTMSRWRALLSKL